MCDMRDGEVREEDGAVVGSEEKGREGPFGVLGYAGGLEGEAGGEGSGGLGGG